MEGCPWPETASEKYNKRTLYFCYDKWCLPRQRRNTNYKSFARTKAALLANIRGLLIIRIFVTDVSAAVSGLSNIKPLVLDNYTYYSCGKIIL